jgi:electron transfer flavoprotein alpha subunit
MKSSDRIIAINTDTDAPIFKTAHIGIVGDIFDIVPALLERIASDSQRGATSANASPMGRS